MARTTYQSILHNSTPYDLKMLQKQGISWYQQQMRDIKKIQQVSIYYRRTTRHRSSFGNWKDVFFRIRRKV